VVVVSNHRWARRALGGTTPLVVVVVLLLVTAPGCSEPERTTFALTVSSMSDEEVCGVGEGTDGLCFSGTVLDVPQDTALLLDDCIGAEIDPADEDRVVRAWWTGRCTTVDDLTLRVSNDGGQPAITLQECLGSLTSVRVEDATGAIRWSVAREVSTQHPLITRVVVGEVPPGFVEHDPWRAPGPDEELEVRVSQQYESLPRPTASFTLGAVEQLRNGSPLPLAGPLVVCRS
jgi:hypothetical protein